MSFFDFHYLKHFISSKDTKLEEASSGILSEKAFHRVLELERARADRYGGRFSLVVFETGNPNNHQISARVLSQVILKRIRPTDAVGRFENTRIGIVLPGTPPWGAHKLSEDICQRISIKRPPPVYKIYTYPSERLRGFNRDQLDLLYEENESVQAGGSEKRLKIVNRWNRESLVEGLEPFLSRRMPAWKRAIDIFGSAVGLVLLFPLLIVIAIVIKVVSAGPALFKQQRIGYLGKPFTIFKFRTMRVNADPTFHTNHLANLIQNDKPLEKLDSDDSRIFPFGKFLRLTGLDELPQLINVLRGEMSLIGPRP
ncbi:MAG: sugar transferase, partial [Desulfobacterales bacterium]